MNIAVFVTFQIILFLQLVLICAKGPKNRKPAGKSTKSNADKKGTSKSIMKNASSKKGDKKEEKDEKKDDKSGEKLDISPTELKWEFEEGQQAIKVKNNTKKRFAIKVKCTDNNIYTVAPVVEFVDVGKDLTVAVVRGKGALKKDKIVLCSMPVSDAETNAADVFKSGNPNMDVITMDKRVRS
ncbi:MSP domain protein [Dictyocaulus viviparus]|uniref:Major sperm protein n=1 Tax=Dictyocaulus viviparus TaxID=29172 RepID=A0A0D8Y1I2_DICVI|nr:MSP domain protein [Dictyocaulus viviparus]